MHAIPLQRLLTHEANRAQVVFLEDNAEAGVTGALRRVGALLVFSPAWAMPLVAAYARAIAYGALGERGVQWLGANTHARSGAALELETHVPPVDGSAQGIWRAAIFTRAAQEALGYTLDVLPSDDPARRQLVNWSEIADRAMRDPQSIAYRLLRAASNQDLEDATRGWDLKSLQPQAESRDFATLLNAEYSATHSH